MKITVTTVYENVDESWLVYFIGRLQNESVPVDFIELGAGYAVQFSSKDPTSHVEATTRYKVDR